MKTYWQGGVLCIMPQVSVSRLHPHGTLLEHTIAPFWPTRSRFPPRRNQVYGKTGWHAHRSHTNRRHFLESITASQGLKLLPWLLFQTQRLKKKNLLHNKVNLIFIFYFYFRGGRLLSQWNGWCFPLISKVTVIFTGKLQPETHDRRYTQHILLKHVLLHSHKFRCWSFKDC